MNGMSTAEGREFDTMELLLLKLSIIQPRIIMPLEN